ncbi:MAG TPA: SUMF1/EgtB/PvdO family nonheme iron enzyme [Phycisphaerae bacterium]|nr:SUMF1/EgtB/PvdO family nonheme iron enzyme [Phycisphaerae bacterium]
MWWARLSLIAIAMMLGAPNWLAVIGLAEPTLLSSEPPGDGTLPKTQSNVILLTFDNPIELPSGPPLSVAPIGGGQDEGDWFLCSVEPDGVTLKAIEDGAVLLDRTWYRITPSASFAVEPFVLDVCTLRGDANGSGRVTTADYVEVKAHMGEYTDARYDLNCTGRVTTADYTVVKGHMGNRAPAKPPSAMVLVPAGEFQMGDTFNEGDTSELPVHTVYLSHYYIDTYEVTNQQYADGLNWAWSQGGLIEVTGGVYQYGSGTPYCDTTTSNSYSRITWNGSTFGVVAGKEDHPMLRVSWYGAVAYCNWRGAMESKPLCYDLSTWECNFGVAGYRLPTEAEWEKAARGGTPGHRFPWSDTDTIQHARANYYSSASFSYDTSATRGYHPLWGVGDYPYTSPVGFFTGALRYKADFGWPGEPTSYQTVNGANGYGLYDMAGNVWEWCYDWYASAYYSDPEATQPNPDGPGSGTYRVLRGGGWYLNPLTCRSAYRPSLGPVTRDFNGGFRCAVGTP